MVQAHCWNPASEAPPETQNDPVRPLRGGLDADSSPSAPMCRPMTSGAAWPT